MLDNFLNMDHDKFKEHILSNSYSVDDFDKLILKDYQFSDDILSDERFIKKVVENRNVSSYRFLINKLSQKNNLSLIDNIDKIRDNYYDEIVDSYNEETGMFKKYEDLFLSMIKDGKLLDQSEYFSLDIGDKVSKEISYDINIIYFNHNKKESDKISEIKNKFIELTKLEFNEILIDRYYKDVPYNFLMNLNNLINFNKRKVIISEDNFTRYQKIKNLYENHILDISFYKSFEDETNYLSEFYDDFNNSKKASYQLIKDSLVNIGNIKKQKNIKESKKNGVDIYEFNGEDFYLLIHNTSIFKSDDNVDAVFNNYDNKDGISLSLISNRRMDYYNNYCDSIVLGFNNIDINYIAHLHNTDSFSYSVNKNNIVSNRVTQLYTPEELIEQTKGYNEIIYRVKDIQNSEFELKPSYVITFNKVEPFDIKVAKKFNIPILKIDKQKYKYNLLISSLNDKLLSNENYAESYFELKNRRK